MCIFCGEVALNPEVAELWRKDYEKLSPENKAFIEHAAEMFKEELEKANETSTRKL